jgi:hypothetical protein
LSNVPWTTQREVIVSRTITVVIETVAEPKLIGCAAIRVIEIDQKVAVLVLAVVTRVVLARALLRNTR